MVMPDHSGRRVGGFELIEPLASGGFATVYRARQVRLDRDVAVKVLDPALARDPDIAARFEREGRAAASLDHPNVVPVYEAGEDDGLVYLAMRLVPGETLDDLLLRGGPLTTARTLRYVEPVAAALDHAHQRDLIHRDVKPSNIFIEGERVWLGDFGIAATADQVGHYTTGALGTAHYMAPEQASRGELDGRADLYALGCVVHRCLTGRPPYDSGELVATLVAHVNEPIPETGNPTLDRFLATALAKDPEARFARGADLVDSLRWIASLGSLEAPAGRGGSDRAPPTQARAGAVSPPAPPSPPPPASTAGSGGIAAAEGTTGSPGVTDRGEFPPPLASPSPSPLASPSPSPSPSPPSAVGPPDRERPNRWPWVVGIVASVALLVGAWLVLGGGDDGGDGASVGAPIPVGDGPVAVDASGTVFTADVESETASAVSPDGGPVSAADLQARPSDVTVSGGQAWVTTLDPGRSVIRFDLAPDEAGQRSFAVALDGFVGAQAASDPDGVWVTDPDGGRVVRLDAAGQEVGEVAVGGEPGALVEGAGSLWVVNDADDTVIRIDPDTMTVVETLSVDGAADAITSTDEAIYITDREASSLTRIDVSDSTSRTTVDVARLPTDPQAGAGGLWLISPEAGTLHRYDFESLTEEQVVDVGGILGGLAIDGDDLWVTRPEAGELVKVTSSD